MMEFKGFERYQWVLTPDGKEYILVDTHTNQAVLGANRYLVSESNINIDEDNKLDYDDSTGNVKGINVKYL
jgi:hypothetical protein